MSKKYFQGESGFAILAGTNATLKKIFLKLKDYKMLLFLETEDGKISRIPTLKVVSNDISIFQNIFEIISSEKTIISAIETPNNQAIFTIGSQKFRLYKSGGRLTNVIDNDGNSTNNKTPSTAQQEDAVRFILESGNTGLPTKESINKAVGFEFGKDWHDSFEKTYDAITTIIPKNSLGQYDFYRDSNPKKIKFLNQITDEKFLPDSKDNWNPSDIWAVKKNSAPKLVSQVEKIYNNLKEGKTGVEELNGFIEEAFNSKDLIGISLKKVAGNKAKIIKVQVESNMADNIVYKGVSSKFQYNVENSYFDILLNFKVYNDDILYRFRFRPRAASGQLKTYGEGQPQDAKVWDGAISSDLINKTFSKIQGWTKFCETELNTVGSVYNALISQTKDKEFADFIKAGKFDLLTVNNIKDNQADSQKIKRAAVLLYYIWNFENTNQKLIFPQMFMAAKKLNSFSSVHYKVS